MSPAQKVIKYFAFAFAVSLMVTILSSILMVISSVSDGNFLFASEKNYINFTKEFENVENLDITNYSGKIYVQSGNVDKIMVEAINVPDSYIAKVSNQTLVIKDNGRGNFIFNLWLFGDYREKETKITITLPQSIQFKKVEFDNGSGSMELSGFQTESFYLDGGSGAIIVSNIRANDTNISTGSGGVALEKVSLSNGYIDTGSGAVNIANSDLTRINFDTGSGSLNFEGLLIGKCSVDGGSGSLAFDINQGIENYDLRFDSGSGGIWVNGKRRDDQDIRNEEANNILTVEGGSGEVAINFAK